MTNEERVTGVLVSLGLTVMAILWINADAVIEFLQRNGSLLLMAFIQFIGLGIMWIALNEFNNTLKSQQTQIQEKIRKFEDKLFGIENEFGHLEGHVERNWRSISDVRGDCHTNAKKIKELLDQVKAQSLIANQHNSNADLNVQAAIQEITGGK